MEFAEFVDFAETIDATTADHDIINHVTDLFLHADEDLPIIARFVQGRIFPAWSMKKLDIGPNFCYEAIARAAGHNISVDDIEERLAEMGDIGDVAASYEFGTQQGLDAFGNSEQSTLTVTDVYEELKSLATIEGEGSQDEKITILFGLFNRCSSMEAKYLARLVLNEMRIGVGEGTVRDAIAQAFDIPVENVERALQVSNDYGEVAVTAREEGINGLDAMELQIGRPIKMMLAQDGTIDEAIEEWEKVGVETKFDGARVQIHVGDSVSIFSRNMEDVTNALPEIVEEITDQITSPTIIDGEVVAIDEEGSPQPFQEILRRFRRKYDIEQMRDEVGVELHAFDCLHKDGTDLLEEPLTKRHQELTELLDHGVANLVLTNQKDEILDRESTALEAGHEGIMLKNPDSTYTPGRRGKNWLKRKPDVETLDLVVTGAEWGEGRRANLLGTFLLAANSGDEFETIGKVATGITDEKLEDLTELLKPHIKQQDGQTVDIEPAIVFEVGYEEIQKSPTYSSGYALRFPRFISVRSDKGPDQADSLDRIESLIEKN